MKKYLFAVAMFALVLVPAFSQASTLSDLQAQLVKLQAQIAALQGNWVPVSSVPTITQTLNQGSRGAQVTSLQRYLIEQGLLAISSPTGYFGSLTRSAVVRWQARNNVSPANGIFGPASRNKLVTLSKTDTPPNCIGDCTPTPSIITPPVYHPADLNRDYVIDDIESQAYTTLWQNGSTVTMSQAIWALVLNQADRYKPQAGAIDGFGPVCRTATNPVCAGNFYHPADIDRNFVISSDEGTTFASYWQNGQRGVTMSQAIWALTLSQADGYKPQAGAIDGFGPVCLTATNPVCANNLYHPADLNQDNVIDSGESKTYTASWQNGLGVTMRQAIWALTLSRADGYRYQPGTTDGFVPVCLNANNPVCAN